MAQAGLELTVSAGERPQTYALKTARPLGPVLHLHYKSIIVLQSVFHVLFRCLSNHQRTMRGLSMWPSIGISYSHTAAVVKNL